MNTERLFTIEEVADHCTCSNGCDLGGGTFGELVKQGAEILGFVDLATPLNARLCCRA